MTKKENRFITMTAEEEEYLSSITLTKCLWTNLWYILYIYEQVQFMTDLFNALFVIQFYDFLQNLMKFHESKQ